MNYIELINSYIEMYQTIDDNITNNFRNLKTMLPYIDEEKLNIEIQRTNNILLTACLIITKDQFEVTPDNIRQLFRISSDLHN